MRRRRVRRQISLLVPFQTDHAHRAAVWRWLRQYWRYELPGCEIVVGLDRHHRRQPFSKTAAVNDAFRRSHGDVIVILDADTYMSGNTIRHCVERIRAAQEMHVPLWFIPYETIYRLTDGVTQRIIASSPRCPLRLSSPPRPEDIEDMIGTSFGHKYGALIQIMPREAFELVGGMDPRFRGWGGEDVCFLRALDTLWSRHKNFPGDVLHLWHPKHHMGVEGPLRDVWKTRVWVGQTSARANDNLAMRYNRATWKPSQMRALVDENRCLPTVWEWMWRRLVKLCTHGGMADAQD